MRWIGDDAAVVRADAFAVTSVDVMVDGTHFRLGQATPADAGQRALAGALSDLAAMGAAPGEAYLASCSRPALGDARRSRCTRAPRRWRGDRRRRSPAATSSPGPALTLAVTVVGWAGADGRARRAATARGPATSSA